MEINSKSINIAILPIDNRPVCYDLIYDTLKLNKNVRYTMPHKELLGSVNIKAQNEDILNWLENLENMDYIIVSLDTVAYGGLIASRSSGESFTKVKHDIDRFFNILSQKKTKVFAFSSILRISNSNVNDEEKAYWDIWGEKIFEYSYLFSKGQKDNLPQIPNEILEDYLKTRKRNFEINKYYLELQKKGMIDYLVFSKDDTAKFGFNIDEAKELETYGATVKTGADELPLSLIARALVDFYEKKLKFNITYSNHKAKSIVSRYEDLTIEQGVKSQIDTIKATQGKGLSLFLNCPFNQQDDYALEIFKDKKMHVKIPEDTDIVVDIASANGCDENFIIEFLKQKNKFIGFSGWNTTSNSIGSALFIGLVVYFAKMTNAFDKEAFNKVIQKRILDDFVYQSIVRGKMRNYKNEQCLSKLDELMKKYAKKYMPDVDFSNAKFYFPCNRTFEIGIDLG